MVIDVLATREKTTMIGLLDWAFQRQRAHVLQDSEGFFGPKTSRDSCAKIENMRGIVGCKIDGGEWKELGHRVHSDAASVVDAIKGIPEFSAHLVWMHACAGTMPDWGEVCRVWPIVRPNGKITVLQEEVVMLNRKGHKSTITVSYCPFQIFPNVEYCREEWRMWYAGLVSLAGKLEELRRWEVVAIGVDAEPWEKMT